MLKKGSAFTAVVLIIFLIAVIIIQQTPGLFQKAYANPGTKTKTVEFFIGQDQTSAGISAGTNKSFSFSVYLPDIISSASAIKSAWVDYSFNTSSTSAPGQVVLGLTPQGQSETVFTSASYTSSAENMTRKIRANFTTPIASFIQSAGTYNFTLRANVPGSARKAENAKISITYDYDDAATTQLRTVKYYVGQQASNLAVNSTATWNMASPGLPENSVTVRSAWAEVTANVVAAGTTDSTIQLWYDSDAASNYYLDNVGGTDSQVVFLMHPKIITDAAHSLKVKPTAGYPLTLAGGEQVITYSFNYDTSTTLLKTMEVLIGTDGTRGATAAFNTSKTVNLPESTISWKSIYLKSTAHAAIDATFGVAAQLNSTPTPATSATYDWNGETVGNYWYLSNETNDLNTMTTGDNSINTAWNISAGSSTSRSVIAVLTYAYDKSSTTENASASYFVDQQTAYGTSGAPSFDVSINGTPTIKGSYLSVSSINGATQDGDMQLSVQPTSTSSYSWNSTGEYQYINTFHDNASSEITGTGTYTANLNATRSNVLNAVATVYWQYSSAPPNQTPTNDSVTFTNPYGGSGNQAVADDTISWNFQAMVTDADGPANLDYVEIRFANSSDSAQPYDSLKYKWTEASDSFSEVADTQNAATITSTNADSNSSGNQWTIDFKIKFNNSFLNKDTQYAIELYTADDSAATDNDNYANKYQVTATSLTLNLDASSKALGNLTPGTPLTGTTTTTVTTNFPSGYDLAVSDSVSGTDSALLHTDTTTRISDFSGTIATPTLWSGDGLGISVYSATNKDAKWGTGTTETDGNNKYAAVPQTTTVIHTKSGSPTSNDNSAIGYKIDVPNTQKTGNYAGDITYSATGALD